MTQNKLSADSKLLIIFSALRAITELFLGTFLISFLMQTSVNEIISVSTYRLFEYAATCAGFFLFANWCKRHNKVAVFALNAIPKIALLIAIILLGVDAPRYVIQLGVLYGIGAAMYYLPINTMVGEKVPSNLMHRFIGIKNTTVYITKIAIPVVLGFFIDTGSYISMAYVLLGLTILELGLAMTLTPSRHKNTTPVDFVGFAKCMLRFPVIKKMFAMEILRGFGNGLLMSVITMYTVYIFQTNFNLGFLTTVFAAFSVITSLGGGYICTKTNTPKIAMICIAIIIAVMTVFISHVTPITFLVYNFMYATVALLLDQICQTNMFKLSKSKCVTNNYKIEYFVFRDFALFIGRWMGFTGLMYIGVYGGYEWLRWYIIPSTIAIVIAGVLSIKLTK